MQVKENSMDVTETLVRELKGLYQTVTGQPYVKSTETPRAVEVPHGVDPIAHLYSEVNQLRQLLASHPAFVGKVRPHFTPCLDARMEGDQVVIRLELAGVSREDVEVLVFDRTILVRGERKMTASHDAPFILIERAFGPFERAISFTTPIVGEPIRGRMHDGILELHVPRRAPATSDAGGRRIDIE
jgi:HSP20 family protein